jgi:ribosomal protein S18 acetylase RimI-like enzyme
VKVAAGTIRELTGLSLEPSAAIIRSAFGKVAPGLGITQKNAPMFPAFITAEGLEEMRARGAVFFGYFLGERQAGTVAVEKREKGYFMERLAVMPEYWHAGIGRELVDFVVGYIKKLGVKELHLGMVNEETVLKKWYEGMGFREVELRKFEGLPFTVCFMARDII